MITTTHNSKSGRVIFTFLLVLSFFCFGAAAVYADTSDEGGCNDALINEIHIMPPGTDPSTVPAPHAGICGSPLDGCDTLLVHFTDYSQGYIDTWAWNFGDPASGADNFSSEENPSHLYTAPGVYSVTLTVTGPGGTNTKTRTNYVIVRESPTADFEYTTEVECAPSPVHFFDRSSGNPNWWRWNFGDGTIVYEQNPVHTYAAPGTYYVTLKAQNHCGHDSVTKEVIIVVLPKPTADFAANMTEACFGADIAFTDLSTNANTWLWDFGDGTASTAQNPTHAYSAAGVYTVSLTVSNDCGSDIEQKVQYITVLPGPIAEFSADQTEFCGENLVQFTDLSQYALSWAWDFGDGSTSTDRNPSHSYGAPGIYTVSLTVTNTCGEDQETKTAYITVAETPIADFTSDTQEPCVNTPVQFTNLSQHATSWFWSFGDGASSNDENPTHTYAAAGTYTVTLAVSNFCGDDQETKTAYITVQPGPTADFTADKTALCGENTVAFTDLSTNATTWAWDFGDGNTSIDRNPSHSYGAPGTYTVSLTVTNTCGEDQETKVEYITVAEYPIADFTSNIVDPCVGSAVLFTDLSQNATSWLWNFGDGTTSTLQNPSHAYTQDGSYTVSLTVTNACGEDQEIKPLYITVYPLPKADFVADETLLCNIGTAHFTDHSLYATSWLWDFGDGGTSTEQHPTHVYATTGVYTVGLVASNGCGADTLIREQYIMVAVSPVAAFTADSTDICEDGTVHFTDLSQNATSWYWRFGDGTTSTEQNPNHTYTHWGDYTVTLDVFNACGVDAEEKLYYISVTGGPDVHFTADVTDVCEGGTVQFTNVSLYANTFEWDFGDGSTSTEANPVHVYAATGTYTVRLIGTNNCGSDTMSIPQFITVYQYPVADFASNTRQVCVNSPVQFTDQSQNAKVWEWEFGDGTFGTGANPTHSYALPGTYSVKLTVVNVCGSDDELKEEYIVVDPATVADFEVLTYTPCLNEEVQFSDKSTNATSWLWNFGDGGTSTEQNPTHTYTSAGSFDITLIATGPCGPDTAIKYDEVVINNDPEADFTATVGVDCQAATATVVNRSLNADTWLWDFGDGTAVIYAPSPAPHAYSTAGTYTITLIAGNACAADTTSREVTIVDMPPVTNADFTADNTGICENGSVHFTDLSTNANSWLWRFGDGGTSTEQNPTHVYGTPGTYTVTLDVTGPCNDDDRARDQYITVAALPLADFSADKNEICAGETVAFTDLSTGADTWSWSFGDGGTSTLENPTHTYAASGAYTVTLTITGSCGEDDETKVNYVLVTAGPTADFSATPRSGRAPLTVAFTDMSTSPTGLQTWSWDFGDGGSAIVPNPSHTYTTPGTYTVSLTVTDFCGDDTETKVEYIFVDSDTCAVDFTAEPTEGCAELTVNFEATSTGDCNISAWEWDFGDPASGSANTATGRTAQHTYAAGGTYSVTLSAYDTDGTIEVTKTDYITVHGAPTAVFTPTPNAGNAPLTVAFSNQSAGATSYRWTFGDPTSGSQDTSTTPSPYHTYFHEGLYEVTLIAANDCGEDTARALITVSPVLTITKEVNKPIAAPGEELEYTVRIHNESEYPIYYVFVSDTIPDSTSLVAGTITGGGSYEAANDVVTWNLYQIDANADVVLSFTVVIDGQFTQFPGLVENQAFAEVSEATKQALSQGRTFASNIVQTIVDQPTGNLTISKAVSAALALPGDRLTYTISVTNTNASPAQNVYVYDAIPEHTTYVNGSISPGGTYLMTNDSLYWSLGTLNGSQSRTVFFDVTVDADAPNGTSIPNTALVNSSLGGDQSNQVVTAVSLTPIVVTKTSNRPSGMIGDLIHFTITVENFSGDDFTNVRLIDTMPSGIYYVAGTSQIDNVAAADPSGSNPYEWVLGAMAAGGSITVEYTGVISTSARPGMHENVARATAFQGAAMVNSNRAIVQIYVISSTLAGSIRGRVVVDCDGDGIADMPAPVGMDVYLDDGSQSKVNEEGMFYFSTVRPGERVVALDERDLDGFTIAEHEQASVFCHVHETGESYVIFRLCPDYPHLDILKRAGIVPTVKITKTAILDPAQPTDSMGVLLDYTIDIVSNGLAEPTEVRVVDSLPKDMKLVLTKGQELEPVVSGDQLIYKVTASHERLQKSVFYSMRDLEPGMRRFLSNKAHIERDVKDGFRISSVSSIPTEVSAGPFLMAPPRDVKVTLTPALFLTSMADLWPEAIPQLEAVADSIQKYSDATVRVEGHTDYRPIHTKQFPSNWELGEARAKAVVDWLVENRGVKRERLAFKSFAATVPVVTEGTTSEQLQPNRRTEVIIEASLAGAFLDPSIQPGARWQNSTSMALDPVKFDTTFEVGAAEIETGLDDSWEIVLTIKNTSAIPADDIVLTDMLPSGCTFIDRSATIDGVPTKAEAVADMVNVSIMQIAPKEQHEVRYRIRAIEGVTPTGGGAASITVPAATRMVIQKSNEVLFK